MKKFRDENYCYLLPVTLNEEYGNDVQLLTLVIQW